MIRLFRKYIKTILTAILVLGLCLFPADELPQLDLPITFTDLIAHFIMFGTLGAALYLDLSRIKSRISHIWISIGFCICFGILTEMLQYLLVGLNRTGNIYDFLFDVLGAVTVILLTHFIKQKFASAS